MSELNTIRKYLAYLDELVEDIDDGVFGTGPERLEAADMFMSMYVEYSKHIKSCIADLEIEAEKRKWRKNPPKHGQPVYVRCEVMGLHGGIDQFAIKGYYSQQLGRWFPDILDESYVVGWCELPEFNQFDLEGEDEE